MRMIRDVKSLSGLLAANPRFSDYDLWRALQTLNDDLHRLERASRPIPIDMLYARRALAAARKCRGFAPREE